MWESFRSIDFTTAHVGAGALDRPAEQRSATTLASGRNLRRTNRAGRPGEGTRAYVSVLRDIQKCQSEKAQHCSLSS